MPDDTPKLYMLLIHAQHLTQRAIRQHGVVQQLRTAAMSNGYDVRPIMIVKNDPSDLNPKLQELQKNVTYDTVGIAEFDQSRQMLGMEAISNIEKHKDAWQRICDVESTNKRDLFMILEDDVFLLPDVMPHFVELLNVATKTPWDINFLGLSQPNVPPSAPMSFIPLRETLQGPMVPAKESYLIKQQTARRLLDMFDKYRYPLRVQLSYMLHKAPEIRAVHPNKRLFLDGSKVGICPSSIHPTNLLVFNKEFMDLFKYLSQSPEVIQRGFAEIHSTYKQVQHIKNPDIMHVYGVLLFKAGRTMDAEDMLVEAAQEMHKQQGLLNSRSDLMTNLINIYQHMQRDLPELLNQKSSYDDPKMAQSDVLKAT